MSNKAILYGAPLTYPSEFKTLSEMFIHTVSQYPKHGMTFIDVSGEENFIAYQPLLNAAGHYLTLLKKKGLKQGDKLLIIVNDDMEAFYKIFWACILGGIVTVPLSQPSFEAGSLTLLKFKNIWQALDQPLVMVEEKYVKYFSELPANDTEFNQLNYISLENIEPTDANTTINPSAENDLAILQFSSGSTGNPKGVMLSHKNIISNLVATRNAFEIDSNDKAFTWVPHTHDMGLFLKYLTAVMTGCNIFVFSPMTFVRSPFLFLKKISEHKGTWFASPNFGLHWTSKNVTDEQLLKLDLSSLKFILNGAEPISKHVIQEFAEKFSKCGYAENKMRPAYGMAEAVACATVIKPFTVPKVECVDRKCIISDSIAIPVGSDFVSGVAEFINVGYPIQGIDVRVADLDGDTLPERMVGEIQLRGAAVTAGYYNRDSLNEKLFDAEGWLHSGDLGFIADGTLVVTGRIKDIIFIRGKNYYAHDLEEIVFKNTTIQRGRLLICGHFNAELQAEELLVFVQHRTGVSKFIPTRESIVNLLHAAVGVEVSHVLPVKSIPKTTSGKLQRFQLQNAYENHEYDSVIKEISQLLRQDQKQEPEIAQSNHHYASLVRRHWANVLNIPEKTLKNDDKFLALGGNSIKAYQLLDAISKTLNREIDPEILIICSTIDEMINYLEKNPKSGYHPKSDLLGNKDLDLDKAIAITGVAFNLPGSQNLDELWDVLNNKTNLIHKVSDKRKNLANDATWDGWLCELNEIECFDNEFFEISDQEAPFMDPQQRLMLETTYHALEDAGVVTNVETEKNIGVYTATSFNSYYPLLRSYLQRNAISTIHQNALVGNLNNMIAARVSSTFNLTGPAMNIDTACSSFLVALHQAVQSLRQKNIDGAIVGGVNVLATSEVHKLAAKAGIVSSSKCAKVLDKSADGTVFGEGVIVIYLETLRSALQSKKNIYGVIRGSAINNDGTSFAVMAPNPKKQYQVLIDAYKDAEITPKEVGYVELHGTGTTIGDPIEMNALVKLFSEYYKCANKTVGIGSVKTNLGHLLSAAGGAGLLKILLSMKHQQLLPTLHCNELNPAINIEQSPFYVVQETTPWCIDNSTSKKASLSSFGFGGTNAHLIVEEWKKNQVQDVTLNNSYLVTLSAKTYAALNEMIDRTTHLIKTDKNLNLNDLCFTRNRYRNHYNHRAALIVSSSGEIGKICRLNPSKRSRKVKITVLIGKKMDSEIGKVFINSLNEMLDSGALIVCHVKEYDKNIVNDSTNPDEFKTDILITLGDVDQSIVSKWSNKIIKLIQLHLDSNTVFSADLQYVMAELYVCGVQFKWDEIHADGTGNIISLPHYPFSGKPFWLDMQKTADGIEPLITLSSRA